MQFDTLSKFTPSPDVLFQEVGGETVLLNLADERYFILNEVGARMWKALSEGENPADIVDAIGNEYATDPETVRADMSVLFEKLHTSGLVTADRADSCTSMS